MPSKTRRAVSSVALVVAKHESLTTAGRDSLHAWFKAAPRWSQLRMFVGLLHLCDTLIQRAVVDTLFERYCAPRASMATLTPRTVKAVVLAATPAALATHNPFNDLPVHLVKLVLTFLPPRDLETATRVCVSWKM